MPLGSFHLGPHHPDAVTRTCRKRESGVLARAARDLGATTSKCWMAGDILDDVAAGRRDGSRTIRIADVRETIWRITTDRVAVDLRDAGASSSRRTGTV